MSEMRIRVSERPTGWELFRFCGVASLIAFVFGCVFLFVCWMAADFDPEVGRVCGKLGLLLVGVLGAGAITHYPWSPGWVVALGGKPDPPPTQSERANPVP
jgi:hypothetical protein